MARLVCRDIRLANLTICIGGLTKLKKRRNVRKSLEFFFYSLSSQYQIHSFPIRKMQKLLNLRGIFRSDIKHWNIYTLHKEFSSLHSGSSSEVDSKASPVSDTTSQGYTRKKDVRPVVDEVCRILGSGSWGRAIEDALSSLDQKHQPELVNGVLKRLDNVKLAMNYFRWVEKKTGQVHNGGAYDALLMVMARNKGFGDIEQILEEISLTGCDLSNDSCIELVATCINSQLFREAFNLIQTMRKFGYCPAFSAYTKLIGAVAAAHEPDLALSLFHQVQEVGYEVNVPLLTTVVCAVARDGHVGAALSLLDEMKNKSLTADIVLYNVCIDCFGKVGKVDIAWKFFHKIKTQGLVPNEKVYK